MSRAAILKRVSQAANAMPPVADDKTAHAAPAMKAQTPKQRIAMFHTQARANHITFVSCAHITQVPEHVRQMLAITGYDAPQVRIAPDDNLQALDWSGTGCKTFGFGAWKTGDAVGISAAAGAIAETGSVIIASGPHSPTSLAFLPDLHIVVLNGDAIVDTLSQALATFVAEDARDSQERPRAMTIISGASRTADIAGKIVHGAHGPRHLGVIVYGSA